MDDTNSLAQIDGLSMARRDTGMWLIRWERDKALFLLVLVAAASIGIGWMVNFFVSFVCPGAGIVGLALGGFVALAFPLRYALDLREAYRQVRARNQDLRTVKAIRQITFKFRSGGVIESRDREIIYQIQRELHRVIEHWTKEANEWREKGHTTYARSLDLIVFDCSDALKLLSQTAAKAEQAIRPQPVARVEVPPPPIAKPIAPTSALAQYRKASSKGRES